MNSYSHTTRATGTLSIKRSRRLALAGSMSLLLALVVAGTASAYTRTAGGQGSVYVATYNTQTRQFETHVHMTADNGGRTQSLKAQVWICSWELNQCRSLGTRQDIVNGYILSGSGYTSNLTFQFLNTGWLASGHYQFAAQYSWYTTAGWQSSSFEYTPWYKV